jgi:hypothetical protein
VTDEDRRLYALTKFWESEGGPPLDYWHAEYESELPIVGNHRFDYHRGRFVLDETDYRFGVLGRIARRLGRRLCRVGRR